LSATKSIFWFFDTFNAAMNWPWLRNPALASSIDIPAGSMVFTRANWSGLFEILIEIALGSKVCVVPVFVVVVPDPVDVPVEVDAVVVVAFFEPPWAQPPVVFAGALAAFAAPPVVLVVDGPCAA